MTGLAFDYQAEVERACGYHIGQGEKVEAMSDYNREVGKLARRAHRWLNEHPINDGQDVDPRVKEGYDAAIDKMAKELEAPEPVVRPFPIISGDGKFYDVE